MALMELQNRITIMFISSCYEASKPDSTPAYNAINEYGIVALSIVWSDRGLLTIFVYSLAVTPSTDQIRIARSELWVKLLKWLSTDCAD